LIEVCKLLRRIFISHGLGKEFAEQEPLFLWEEAVGERVARLTKPLQVREGTIFVEVRSHVLAQELSMLKEEYIKRINKLLGEERVRDIRFRVGAGGALRQREREEEAIKLEEVPLSTEEREEIDHLVREVDDERLREALRRFLITERRIEKVRLERGFRRCPRCGGLHRDGEELCIYCQPGSGQNQDKALK